MLLPIKPSIICRDAPTKFSNNTEGVERFTNSMGRFVLRFCGHGFRFDSVHIMFFSFNTTVFCADVWYFWTVYSLIIHN